MIKLFGNKRRFSLEFISMFLVFLPFPTFVQTDISFRDVTAEVGIDFKHFNDFSPERRLVETMGSGGALFDFDKDGDLDIYLVQGNSLTNPNPNLINRLYRNDGQTFADVTIEAGCGDSGYGMGVVAADYNGDGYQDLYVTNLGPNVLFRNNGDNTFTDVTTDAGVKCDLLSTSSAFADIDQDGDLDLYVCNYVGYSLDSDIPCYYQDMRIYCGPNDYQGIEDTLYRNNGDGTFTDVTQVSGTYIPDTRGLGVVFTDLNNDGLLDIYVANDMNPNKLFVNQGEGKFAEEGTPRGCAYNADGIANGSMGIDAQDFDNDGDIDLWMTNFSLEANCLMINDGNGYFDDFTFDLNLAKPSFHLLGFGTLFADCDNNGWKDLVVGNGHIWDNVHLIDPSMDYLQPLQIFSNFQGQFQDRTNQIGFNQNHYVVRGLIRGDIDNDGDVDLVLCQSNRHVILLRNEAGNRKSWIVFRLVGKGKNTDAIGSRVQLKTNGITQTSEVICGSSYLVGNDMRLHFGLDDANVIEKVTIRWADGTLQTLKDISARQILMVAQK